VVRTGAELALLSPAGLVGFAATLSVNLAVLNALPFPALDGGQLVFVLIELLLKKPLPRKFQESITGLAFFVLLGLGSTTLVGDLGKLNQPIPGIPKLLASPPSLPSSIAPLQRSSTPPTSTVR